MEALAARIRNALETEPAAGGNARAVLRAGAALHRLDKEARSLRAKMGRRNAPLPEADAVAQLAALFEAERAKLRTAWSVEVSGLEAAAQQAAGAEPAAAEPAPRPRPIPAPRRFGPQPLKFCEGTTPGEPIEIAIDRLFRSVQETELEAGRTPELAAQAGINSVVTFINERLVDLTHVGEEATATYSVALRLTATYLAKTPVANTAASSIRSHQTDSGASS